MSNRHHKISPPQHKQEKSKNLNQEKLEINYRDIVRRKDCNIIFSFKYLDLNDGDFSISKCEAKWFIKLLERKKDYCGMTPQASKQAGKSTRCHPIDWADTSKKGFKIPALSLDIGKPDECQLSISRNRGRILGFFIENVFYIVWLDPDHNLYD